MSVAGRPWQLVLVPIPGIQVSLYVTVRSPSVVDLDLWKKPLHLFISVSPWLLVLLPPEKGQEEKLLAFSFEH